MTENITPALAKFIAEKILKQAHKIIKPDEALIPAA